MTYPRATRYSLSVNGELQTCEFFESSRGPCVRFKDHPAVTLQAPRVLINKVGNVFSPEQADLAMAVEVGEEWAKREKEGRTG